MVQIQMKSKDISGLLEHLGVDRVAMEARTVKFLNYLIKIIY